MEKASSVHNENTPLLGQCIFYLQTPPPPLHPSLIWGKPLTLGLSEFCSKELTKF